MLWIKIISELSGILLGTGIYVFSIYVHELAHYIATRHYCRTWGSYYACKIIIFLRERKKRNGGKVKKVFHPHTESKYYTYLEENRYDPEVQKIIRNIAIVGYPAKLMFLAIVTALFMILIKITMQTEYLILFFRSTKNYIAFLFGYDIAQFISSSDMEYIKHPEKFYDRYRIFCTSKEHRQF